jgi:ParB family transcriptional regulator, chromosome partitioning protein
MTDVIIDLSLDAIELRNRLRPIEEASMLALAASFGERGQDAPVIVRDRDDGSNKVRLVAGAHRVAAARYLGWETIKAVVRSLSDDEARLTEIDENVVRRELSALDRAVFLAERKKVYERLHPETKHGGSRPRKGEEGQVANMATFNRYSKDAAKKTGLSERSVQRATELAMKLDPSVIEALRLSPLAENSAALKKLSLLPADQQIGAARALATGEARNIAGALIKAGFAPAPIDLDPDAKLLGRWTETLSRTNATQRRALLLELLRFVKTGEFAALASALASKLPATRQKQIHAALTEALASHEVEVA